MEEQQRQIWQRVSSPMEPTEEDIRPLILEAARSLGVYRHLAAGSSGGQREQIQGLQRLARQTLDALRGIQTMSGHSAGDLHVPSVFGRNPRRILEGEYFSCLVRIREYLSRSGDPRYGGVYRRLAEREEEMALILAQLVGNNAE